jgi:membrane protease YdiL (CAAX protease family)
MKKLAAFIMKFNKTYLLGELTLLFILIPCVLYFDIPGFVKAGFVLIGIAYVIKTVIKNQLFTRRSFFTFPLESYWKAIVLRFMLLIIFSIILMYFSDNEKLFIVVKTNPVLWLVVCIFYSTVSVYPQEFLYRSFFFSRYGLLFKNTYLLIAINALVFSFAHIVFKNLFVLIITLIGGVIFAITFFRTRSLLLTSVEHALYGSWLFTVGMGEMLAFPMPE